MKVRTWAWLLLSLVVLTIAGLWIVQHERQEQLRDSVLRSESGRILNDSYLAVGEKGVNELKNKIARDAELRNIWLHQDLGVHFSVYSSSWSHSLRENEKQLFDTRITVSRLFGASPLARAGLHPNDHVLSIDRNRPCPEIATEETMYNLRSKCEEEISELLKRAKDTFTIRVARWGEIHEFRVKKSDVGDEFASFEAFIAANMSDWVKQIQTNHGQYVALKDEFEHLLPAVSHKEVDAYHAKVSRFYHDVARRPWHELDEKSTELVWYSQESRFFPSEK